MPNIESHHRDNYENTDSRICTIESLVTALEVMRDQYPHAELNSREGIAMGALMNLLTDQFQELHRLRLMEWAGLGGNTEQLTEAEIAQARGEAGKAA